MVAAHICGSCRGVDLAALGIPTLTGHSEPDHCYGRSDRPAPEGVLGGYRCSCPCRGWLVVTERDSAPSRDDTRDPSKSVPNGGSDA